MTKNNGNLYDKNNYLNVFDNKNNIYLCDKKID